MTTQDTPVTTIIGLDPALGATGIAAWRDGRLATQTVFTSKKSDDPCEIDERMRWIVANIVPYITRRTFVVLEAPYITDNGATSMKLAGLHYVIRYALHARRVPFGVITPGKLKKFATGNGGTSKAGMVDMATATFGPGANLVMGSWTPLYERVDDNSHEADALWCLAAALHHTWVSNALDAAAMEPGLAFEQSSELDDLTTNWPVLEWEGKTNA